MRPMCLPSKVLWCFVLLLVASSSKSQKNSTNGDKQNDSSTMRYDLSVSSVKYRNYNEIKSTRCNSLENSIKNDEMQYYEPHINSTKNEREEDNSKQYESRGHIINDCEESNQISMEPVANSTEINDSMTQEIKNLSKIESESNSSTSYEHGNKNSNKNSKIPKMIGIVPYETCHNVTCVQLCCPFRNFIMITGKCVANENGTYYLPKLNKYKNGSDDALFSLTVHDPCLSQGFGRSLLPHNEYLFLTDGSLYQGPGKFILPTFYCLASFNREIYEVMVCNNNQREYPVYASACLLVSLPFLLLTFVIYSILPELQNMHGYTMRAHVASLFITYAIMYCGQQVSGLQQVDDEICCITLAYILNFFFLSTFFWLNIICFDIWWTFRGLRSYRTTIKQGKKKFVIYSIYAWGIPLILNIIYVIMDYVDGIPENWIKPQICTKKFWFGENMAKTIYFYIPMGATIISNICFFIATTVTIMYQNIHTAHQLRDSESKRHNENKQRFVRLSKESMLSGALAKKIARYASMLSIRFKMYLKLFIVMGISWIMEIIAWLINSVPPYVWYPTNIINSLQGLIIFIIFVCKKKIKRLLLKRFGGQNCGPFCKIPMYNDSTSSNITGTSTLGTVPMQEINYSNQHPNVLHRFNLTRNTIILFFRGGDFRTTFTAFNLKL